MPSLKYNNIFQRLYAICEAYDFLDLTEIQINDFLCNFLHSSVSKPHVRRIFTTLSLDDEIQEISYELKTKIDEETDEEFIIEVLSLGMQIQWLTPKVYSIRNIQQTYGSTELKFFSESSHLKEIKDLLRNAKAEQRQLLSDRSGTWNSYLQEEE